ncbi:uncharacterized protein LOC126673371 isoform X2 [Mercurialis annua]|uniref:uncharacterized protein LOC126673371 isoform X2 n=1 Tax=Mercurialis annua TaxID=3986 RepID=UPI0021601B22|nr:uncharacterized protein LOC126673371 isoform X2 [Mercurialis annua]
METPEKPSSSSSSSVSPLPASASRLWRPAAQRNLRNQWSKLASSRTEWLSCSSKGRSHATAFINAYLSQKYMPSMELGVLKDMPDIKNKASSKLFKQQVDIVINMVNTSRLMRCYVKGPASSPILKFSSTSEDHNDDFGDGGGIPVFTFLPISSFEKLADELVQMFVSELNLKRLLVVEFVTSSCEDSQVKELIWSNELYPGEFDDLSIFDLYSNETCKLVTPKMMERENAKPTLQFKSQANHEVYLTTWLAEVNIDTDRVDEIFSVIGEEMHVSLLIS